MLRIAIDEARSHHPFDLTQSVLLPDHLHLLMQLPDDTDDFSKRVAAIKHNFTREWNIIGMVESQSTSRDRQRHQPVWQKRFWEHLVKDDDARIGCEAYIWFNAVHHGLCRCPHEYPWSSFHRMTANDLMPHDWLCVCNNPVRDPPRLRTDWE